MEILNFTAPSSGGWLVDIISWLVKIGGSVALGVILFTVLLKLITLPFDYVSRASMRKNSLKMEEMRPELEKLQRQYANNSQLYQQKVMALYKKEGYIRIFRIYFFDESFRKRPFGSLVFISCSVIVL